MKSIKEKSIEGLYKLIDNKSLVNLFLIKDKCK